MVGAYSENKCVCPERVQTFFLVLRQHGIIIIFVTITCYEILLGIARDLEVIQRIQKVCRLHVNQPLCIRDISIHFFWYPGGVGGISDPIPEESQGMTFSFLFTEGWQW